LRSTDASPYRPKLKCETEDTLARGHDAQYLLSELFLDTVLLRPTLQLLLIMLSDVSEYTIEDTLVFLLGIQISSNLHIGRRQVAHLDDVCFFVMKIYNSSLGLHLLFHQLLLLLLNLLALTLLEVSSLSFL
jgi:hypothetical protein